MTRGHHLDKQSIQYYELSTPNIICFFPCYVVVLVVLVVVVVLLILTLLRPSRLTSVMS